MAIIQQSLNQTLSLVGVLMTRFPDALEEGEKRRTMSAKQHLSSVFGGASALPQNVIRAEYDQVQTLNKKAIKEASKNGTTPSLYASAALGDISDKDLAHYKSIIDKYTPYAKLSASTTAANEKLSKIIQEEMYIRERVKSGEATAPERYRLPPEAVEKTKTPKEKTRAQAAANKAKIALIEEQERLMNSPIIPDD